MSAGYSAANGIATITLDGLDGLADAWARFAGDDSRVAVLISTGPDFCLGGPAPEGAFPVDHALDKPVIVAVQGRCVGTSLRFVGQGDIVIAADDAIFSAAPLTDGLPVEEMIYQRRRLPEPLTELLFMSGGLWTIDAARAFATGWVSEVVLAEDLANRAQAIAATIAGYDPTAVQLTKLILTTARDGFTRDALEQARALVPARLTG